MKALIVRNRLIFFAVPVFYLFCTLTCFSQNLQRRLSTIQDSRFEIVGAEDFGPHKSSRSERETLSLVFVVASTKYLQQSDISKFLSKIKSQLTESESFFIYFMDNRKAANNLVRSVQLDEEPAKANKFTKNIKALFACLKNDNKEFLRFFKNGMTEKDFEALDLELEN